MSQMDWMEQEKERGITITSAATTAHWRGYRFNIIDTPGHVDFTIEVERSLRVLDGAIALIDAQAGVETQTEQVWRQANEYKVPRMIFANKMDKMGADFEYSLRSIKDRLSEKSAPIEWPIGAESEFNGIIDLVTMKAYHYDGEEHEEAKEIEIPEDLKATAEARREELIEAVSEFSDELMEAYLEGAEITVDMLNNTVDIHRIQTEPWKVTMLYTGLDTMTGSRIKKAQEYIGNERFMLTYGDGVSDVNIKDLLKYHESKGKYLTMTAVQPSGKFGALNISSLLHLCLSDLLICEHISSKIPILFAASYAP